MPAVYASGWCATHTSANRTDPPSSVFGMSFVGAKALLRASSARVRSSSEMASPRRATVASSSSSRVVSRVPLRARSASAAIRTEPCAHSDQYAAASRSITRRHVRPRTAEAPYSERMPPASWPLFCRSWIRATLDTAGIASAITPAAIASAIPISSRVMPRARTVHFAPCAACDAAPSPPCTVMSSPPPCTLSGPYEYTSYPSPVRRNW